MEILMVRLDFSDGLDGEYLVYGINRRQVPAAEEAVQRAERRYDARSMGETFEDALEKEFEKAGIRFKCQGYHMTAVKVG